MSFKDYLFNTAKSPVMTHGRTLYKQVRDNREYIAEFAKDQISAVKLGKKSKPSKIVSLNPMKLSLGKPAVFDKNDICVILKPESQTIRIVGSGAII